jgi:FAD/FMN-containing dehydrogenase
MSSTTMRKLDGTETTVDDAALSALDGTLSGRLIRPGDPDYDEARALWNAMIDRRPGVIARVRDVSDVARSVRFAKDHDLLLAIKGAGHNIAGRGVCDGGMVIDFAEMKNIDVDPGSRIARVEAGCTLGDLDAATQPHGLAIPVGINSTTGIAGLTLGGGFGWLSRKHGLTVDSLRSAQVVTADGEEITASETENPDLFWAIRGGGGNFGVVTSFDFALHPLGPEIFSGLVIHSFDQAEPILKEYRRVVAGAPDEVTTWAVLRKAPPLPFLPEEWHGKHVLILAGLYAGDPSDGEEAFKEIRGLGNPIVDVMGPHDFSAWQQAFDPLLTPGARNYWKSHDLTELSDGLIDTLTRYSSKLPSDATEIFVAHLGGAVNRIPDDATAYPHRDVEFVINVHARWDEPAEDARCMEWAREFFHASAPFATGGVYVNFMPEDEEDRTGGAFGANLVRLSRVKQRYDPDNFFRVNQNISPA